MDGSSPERILFSACAGWLQPNPKPAVIGLKYQKKQIGDATVGNQEGKFLKEGSQTQREETFQICMQSPSVFQMNSELCLHGEDSNLLVEGYSWKAEEAGQRRKLPSLYGRDNLQSLNLVKFERLEKHLGLPTDTHKGHSLGVK